MGEPAEQIVIDNFSPGIFADLHGFSGATATANPSNVSSFGPGLNGGAVIDDTFGCRADFTGALTPLPAAVQVAQAGWQGFATAGQTSTSHFPTGKVGYYLLDAKVISYLVTDDHDAQTERDAVFMIFGAFYAPSGGGTYRQLVWGVIAGLDIDMWKVIHWNRYAPAVTTSPALSIPSASIGYTRHVDGRRSADGFLDYGIYATANTLFFVISPSRDGGSGDDNTAWATGAIPVAETDLSTYVSDTTRTDYPVGVDTTPTTYSGVIGVFPDPLTLRNPQINTTDWYPRYIGGLVALPGFLGIVHQGRGVIASLLSRGFGAGFNVVLDRIAYSPVYNAGLGTAVVDPETNQSPTDYRSSIAGDDNPAPIGTMGSIVASEMLIVKHGRGGVLMRGDLDNFEAVALPYIESTYGLVHLGVPTPIGFVYGSRNGVFVWSGGQATEKLSKQIDGYFWEHDTDVVYTGNQARFGYWHPYVLVPNDYIYDIEAKSWWKLEDSASTARSTYAHYDVSALNGKMYAFNHLNLPGADPGIFVYDPDVLRSSYSWKSLPLLESRRRLLTYQDIELTVTTAYPWTAATTITVTLVGYSEAGDQITSLPTVFTLNTTPEYGSQVQYKQLVGNGTDQAAFTGRYVQARIEATSATGPAPKIHRIGFGVREAQRQRVQ